MSKTLFNEFESVSSKEWKQKIQVDLKGADYNETLIWSTYEGIDVKPFYHADEFSKLPEVSTSKIGDWKICETISDTDTRAANAQALTAIEKGAESIFFQQQVGSTGVTELLNGIDTEKISVDISFSELAEKDIIELKGIHEAFTVPPIIHFDSIANLARTGNWFTNLLKDHSDFESIVAYTNHMSIDLSLYQNAGANCVQQLAYALAHSNEYLNELDSKLNPEAKTNLQISFINSVGSNYFFEIAKVKALRQLWHSLADAYAVNTDCRIISTPSKRNKSIYDYNVNMLRTTTECMSAILGGSDVISNRAYDSLYHSYNDFGSRIARNQLLILKHESYFDKVNNPTDGAYYVEKLTTQLAEKALGLFKEIEVNGGFLSQLKAGTIQRKIKASAAREQADFDDGKLVLLGINKHPNPSDIMAQNLEISPFLEIKNRKTLIEPIIEKRLSEKLEMKRLSEEKN